MSARFRQAGPDSHYRARQQRCGPVASDMSGGTRMKASGREADEVRGFSGERLKK